LSVLHRLLLILEVVIILVTSPNHCHISHYLTPGGSLRSSRRLSRMHACGVDSVLQRLRALKHAQLQLGQGLQGRRYSRLRCLRCAPAAWLGQAVQARLCALYAHSSFLAVYA
jgi:hypothetical protein